MTAHVKIPLSDLASLSTYASASTSRLHSLYADIARQKLSNPAAFQSTVSWWRATLQSTLAKGWQPRTTDKLILHADPVVLPEALRYEGVGKPLCLSTVIAELANTKTLIPLNQFLVSRQSIYDPGWLPYRIASFVLGKPLWWALQQMNIVSADDGNETDAERWKYVHGDYVFVDLLEQAASAVITRQRDVGTGLADALYNFESFKDAFAAHALPGVVLSDADVRVLVKFLQRDKHVLVADKDVIKFSTPAVEELSEITTVDCGILELKTAISRLQVQTNSLQQKIDACTRRAMEAVRQKHEMVAKTCLRARKHLSEVLAQRHASLETLQSTLIQVEAAADNIHIMKSYESSTATLRALLAHPSLQRESVDKTLDAIANANADAREIDDAIRVGGDIAASEAGATVDDDEIAAELASLAAEEREKEELERLGRLQAQKDAVERERIDASQTSQQERPMREHIAEAA
ncbi:Snf7-domain-containing protein [Vararia minispora EC-137]|uniref:Snf7-domain-containing protein n=1 Tax=Vararia minispora EC-137 TaxID=1314806 RepID=A0ACB8QK20_9AGAM|nr:Snf7-domain-containing protein [Vararia minispora EC-137]